jgi:hypothetical protein
MDLTEIVRDVIIVLIPTAMGVITSKWITNSWQQRKEETEIKRKILEQMDESYHKSYSLIANFVNRVHRGYDEYTPRYDANNNMLPQQMIFPTNSSEMPFNKFKDEFLRFQKEYDDISYAENRFGSSLALYYPSFLNQLQKVIDKIELAFHTAIKLYHCQDKTSFEVCFDVVKDMLNEARRAQQELAFSIIKSKINRV